MPFLHHVNNFVVTYLIHVTHLLQRFDRFHANKCCAKRHWTETRVKVKETNVGIYSQKFCHIHIIG